MLIDKSYVINLDDDIHKKDYFYNEISKTSIKNVERFSAINGYQINLSEINDDSISHRARADILSPKQHIFGISLTYGSLGCALSHKKIFEECQNSKNPFLIFEDDIIVNNNFDKFYNNILQCLDNLDFDIFYLGYNEIPGFHKKQVNGVYSKPSGLITGLYGYIVSPNGAKKLLQTIFPLDYQIDSSISHNSQKLELYCSTTKIIGVTHKFGSKTQKNKSCQNLYRDEDNWKKLFQ